MAPSDVLIVGAGPTGLVLAAELCRHGIRPRIVDQNASPPESSRAVAVHARTLEILDQMGLLDPAAIQAGHAVHGASVYAGGKRLLHFTFDELDSPFRYALDLPQRDLERIVERRLNDFGVAVERGITVTGVQAHAEGVTVFLQGPSSQRFETAYLAGCDGAHSTVRHTSGFVLDGPMAFEAYVGADVRFSASVIDDEWLLYFDDEGALACSPMRDGWFRVIAEGKLMPDAQPDTIRSVLRAHVPACGDVLDVRHAALYRVQSRGVATYQHGRVLLAGDAAHTFSPAGGQGMNAGVQDAHNLAWKLALTLQGKVPAAVLSSYSEERTPAGRAVLAFTEQIASIANLRGPVTNRVRNRLLPLLAGFDVFQQRLSRQVSETWLNYRTSPIVSQHGRWYSPGPMPGDRALDTILPTGKRFFESLDGTGHTVLLFTGEHPSGEELRGFGNIARYMREGYPDDVRTVLVSRRPIDWDGHVLVDAAGAVHYRYGAGLPCVYIVRPDGYIGFRTLSAEPFPVLDYFGKLFEPANETAAP